MASLSAGADCGLITRSNSDGCPMGSSSSFPAAQYRVEEAGQPPVGGFEPRPVAADGAAARKHGPFRNQRRTELKRGVDDRVTVLIAKPSENS